MKGTVSDIPVGYCQCGCGVRTKIAHRDDYRLGWTKGQYIRFIMGHGTAKPRRESRLVEVEGKLCRTIPLTHGKETIVSLHRYESLSVWHWIAVRGTRTWYVKRREYLGGEGHKQRSVSMHRVILGLSYGDKREVDHWNGNGLDNRDENLRLSTSSQNKMNAPLRKDNKVGLKGVSWCKPMKKWRSRIKVNGQEILLGYFDDPKSAYLAYCDAAPKYHGEFARTK